jgi:hypothetical protein
MEVDDIFQFGPTMMSLRGTIMREDQELIKDNLLCETPEDLPSRYHKIFLRHSPKRKTDTMTKFPMLIAFRLRRLAHAG